MLTSQLNNGTVQLNLEPCSRIGKWNTNLSINYVRYRDGTYGDASAVINKFAHIAVLCGALNTVATGKI